VLCNLRCRALLWKYRALLWKYDVADRFRALSVRGVARRIGIGKRQGSLKRDIGLLSL